VSFLTQDIEPTPDVQLTQDRHRAKFTVSDEKNSSTSREQGVHIRQQGQLFTSSAMSSDMLDPGPCNGNSPLSVWQTDDQQLMPKTDLGAIHNQPDLSDIAELGFQPLPGNGFIPLSHPDARITQQATQTSNSTQQLCRSRNFSGYSAQAYRSAFINTNYQHCEIADASDPLGWLELSDLHFPSIIECGDRHNIVSFFLQITFRSTNFVPIIVFYQTVR
jgi:hypothetical protein